jgi:hypothetical protein
LPNVRLKVENGSERSDRTSQDVARPSMTCYD